VFNLPFTFLHTANLPIVQAGIDPLRNEKNMTLLHSSVVFSSSRPINADLGTQVIATLNYIFPDRISCTKIYLISFLSRSALRLHKTRFDT